MPLLNQKNEKRQEEEAIRHAWLQVLCEQLGYPLSLLVVEKEISQLPHLYSYSRSSLPRRRVDIVAFGEDASRSILRPLVLIECKAVPLSTKCMQQVMGYNAFVQAPFIAIANANTVLTGRLDLSTGNYAFVPGLPTYAHACSVINASFGSKNRIN